MRDFFTAVWRKRGLADHQIEAKWEAWRAEQQKNMPLVNRR